MNPTKAAAIIALIVTIGAAAYLVYQATVVRAKYDADVTDYEHCMAGRRAATANWDYVQSQIGLLNAQGKYKEALDFGKQHAGERPLFIGECGQFLDLKSPIYAWPAGISTVGLITSLVLFGAAKPKA
jgi:hypothetical protein